MKDKSISLEYPRNEGNPKCIVVDLMDVRAADPIRISYDFHRDGWMIEQQSVFRWDGNDDERDPIWKESTFIPAWQFDEEHP